MTGPKKNMKKTVNDDIQATVLGAYSFNWCVCPRIIRTAAKEL